LEIDKNFQQHEDANNQCLKISRAKTEQIRMLFMNKGYFRLKTKYKTSKRNKEEKESLLSTARGNPWMATEKL
jgi:hypothetical protein